MSEILIIYGSSTGNTARTADIIDEVLKEKGFKTKVENVSYVETNTLESYENILFGCSTWGIEEIELQDDFIPFYENMDKLNLKDKKTAVFGCGDLEYKYFCGAVDVIEEKVKSIGGKIVNFGLKIEGEPEDNINEIKTWAEQTADSILK
jgi:flavodoxin short chain